MKPHPIIFYGLFLSLTCLLLISCNDTGVEGSSNSSLSSDVYMPQAVKNPISHDFLMADSAQTIHYGANYGGVGDPSKDIHIQFKVNSSLIDSFNTANNVHYSLLPSKSYDLGTTTAVISKGKRSTKPYTLKIKTHGYLKPSTKYLLPVSVMAPNNKGLVKQSIGTTYYVISAHYNIINVFMPLAVKPQPVSRSVGFKGSSKIPLKAAYKGESAGKDITVDFALDPALANSFNQSNGTNYETLPADNYQLNQTSVTIPAGKTETQPLNITIQPKNIDPDTPYLLPVHITNTQGNLGVGNKIALAQDSSTTYFLVSARKKVDTTATFSDFDRSNWKIIDKSDDQPPIGYAKYAIDDDKSTSWQTKFAGGIVKPPHYLTLDMGSPKVMHGFWFINRQGSNAGSTPKGVHVDVSKDNEHWTSAGDFKLGQTKNRQNIYFNYALKARYFKFTINTTYSQPYTYIAELGAF